MYKNHYEEIIDLMILNEISEEDIKIKELINKLPLKQKRLAILSILDKDRGMFLKIKKIIENTAVSKTKHISDVVEMLRDYVKVGDIEKKKFGEVMTPISLVDDMLDTLPKEVWTNPNLKWLDPANGVGVFPSVVIQRLMNGLKDVITDDEFRYKHIVENMIHVCELQPKNMFLHLCAFDPEDTYLLNVYTGSFLTDEFSSHAKNVWNVDKFDVIVGNPPYQELKEGNKKSKAIWHHFVEKAIHSLTDETGLMCMVHPSGWRNVMGAFKETQKLILSKDVSYLEMHNFKDGIDNFGAQINYDFYCLQNSFNRVTTTIKDVNNNVEYIKLQNVLFIPNTSISKVYSLLHTNNENKIQIIYSRSLYGNDKQHMCKIKTNEHKYPCVYTIKKHNVLNLWYSNIKAKHFNTPKIIITNGSAVTPYLDKNGDYGIMNFGFGISDTVDRLVKIKKALTNKKFIKNIMGFNGLGNKYDKNIISLLHKDFWKEFI